MELVSARRDVALVMAEHCLSERQACRLLELDRSTYRYEPRPDANEKLQEALVSLARQKPRYGYRRLWAILTRRGWDVNVKRIYRLYREEGLMVRRLKRKRIARATPADPLLTAPNHEWALDFVSDALASGRGVRALMPSYRSGNRDLQPAGDANAGEDHRSARKAEMAAVRQRPGVHQPALPGVVRRARHSCEPYSTRETHAKRSRGELQRAVAG